MKKVILIIFAAIFLALVLFFLPYKLGSRLDLDEFKGNKVEGSILFYGHAENNERIEISDRSAADELIDYLGSLRVIRSFKGNEFPPPDTDHMYDFYLYDKDGKAPVMLTITGKSIQFNFNKKFWIFPKYIDIRVIDDMVAEYFTGDIPDFMEPIEYEDISATSEFGSDRDILVQVLRIEGHSETGQFIIFNGLKPYQKLEVYESGETLIIYYDETEGNPKEVAIKVESLPFYPQGKDNKIIFILNGKRSYSTEYVYGME